MSKPKKSKAEGDQHRLPLGEVDVITGSENKIINFAEAAARIESYSSTSRREQLIGELVAYSKKLPW